MARPMRYALLLLPLLLITTACRFVEQQKDLAARIAAFRVLRPVLQMQSNHAQLTQSSFRETDAVAAKRMPVIAAPSVSPVVVVQRDAMRVHIDGKELRTMALAEAHAAIAMARCEMQIERQRQRLQRKRIIVVMPKGNLELPAPPIG
jgi:hypothetical protein